MNPITAKAEELSQLLATANDVMKSTQVLMNQIEIENKLVMVELVGLTVKEISEWTGVHRSTVYRWEATTPSEYYLFLRENYPARLPDFMRLVDSKINDAKGRVHRTLSNPRIRLAG